MRLVKIKKKKISSLIETINVFDFPKKKTLNGEKIDPIEIYIVC